MPHFDTLNIRKHCEKRRNCLLQAISPFLTKFSTLYGACFLLSHLSTTCSRGAFRVVRCLSCVVNNFFKHLLLPNRWTNLDQTWQECSLGGPLQKSFTEFYSIKNFGCHGNKIEFLSNSLKNLLLRKGWSDFKIISQECSLGDPFQKLFTKF